MDYLLDNEPEIKEIPKNDILKIIAMVSMLIDHIGYVLFPDLYFLRIIGRLAFPIFAYSITIGYIKTRDLRRYMLRLLLFGVVSQIPYSFFSPGRLNIMFTLLVGLYIIYCIDRKKFMLLPLAVIAGVIVPMDYGIYGIAVIVLFYIFRDNPSRMGISHAAATFVYAVSYNVPIQMFCIISLFFILKKWEYNIAISKYIFYIFYPVHISVIMFIAWAF